MKANDFRRQLSLLRLRKINAAHLRAANASRDCEQTENAERAVSVQKIAGAAMVFLLLGQSMLGQGECNCPANPAAGAPMPNASVATAASTLLIDTLIDTDDYPACFLTHDPNTFTVLTACKSWGKKENKGAQLGVLLTLEQIRNRFWETFQNNLEKSNKRDAAKARGDNVAAAIAKKEFDDASKKLDEASKEFGEMLFLKDLMYLKGALMSRKHRDARDNPTDFIRTVNGFGVLGLAGHPIVDGGISLDLASEFYDWSMAVRESYGEPRSPEDFFKEGLDEGGIGADLQKAIVASRAKYKKYVVERNWEEYRSRNRAPLGFEESKNYGKLLYLREAKLKPAEAEFAYCSAEKVLGSNVAAQAAKQVQDAPKKDNGDLVQNVRRGPVDDSTPMPQGVIGVYSNQLVAFEKLMTMDDDRRYLLGLLTHLNWNDQRAFVGATKWCFAKGMYDRYDWAFGKEAVQWAARVVRTTPKRMSDGWVLDTKAIGSTRFEPYPAFEEVLVRKEPKGYVRAMLEFGENLGKDELQNAYDKLVAEHGENAVLDAARKMAAGRPEPTKRDDLEKLRGMLGENGPASEPARAPLRKTPPSKVSGQPVPAPSAQPLDIHQRYRADLYRSVKANSDLLQFQRTTKTVLPADIRQALNSLNPKLSAAQRAIAQGDTDHQAEKDLQDVEATLDKIETFLHSK